MAGQLDQLRAAGFSDDEVSQYAATKSQTLSAAGFNQQEIGDYLGVPVDKTGQGDAALRSFFKSNIQSHVDSSKGPDGTAKPLDFTQALEAGMQMSVAGLATRGKMPDRMPSGNEEWYSRLAYSTAQVIGDVPAMMAGAALGGGSGAATGPGAAITATAGAFALPAGLRSAMVDAYSKGEFHNFNDFFSRASGILLDEAKGWVTGAATGGAGAIAGKTLAAATPAIKTVGQLGAELTTMVTVGKALEGEVPSMQDFVDGALLLGGAKAGLKMSSKLGDIYAKTGIKPDQVVSDAKTDPTIIQDIASGRPIPKAYEDQVDPWFHGSGKADLTELKPSETGAMGPGLYITKSEEGAQMWADVKSSNYGGAATVYPLDTGKLNLASQIDFNKSVEAARNQGASIDEAIASANKEFRTQGFDGILSSDGNNAVLFDATKAKVKTIEPGSVEEAKQKILSKIEVGGEDIKTPLTLDKLYTKALDDLNPIKNAVDAMTKGQEIPASENPYVQARLLRGVYGKAQQFIENSPFKYDTLENEGKSLKSILDPVREDLNGLRAYSAAARAIELDGRGIKSGFDVEAAKQVVEAGKSAYEPVLKEVIDYQNRLTAYLRDSGVLDKKTYDAMLEANKSYVPFYRVFEESQAQGVGLGIKTRNPIKKIKGSSKDVIDPLESIIKNTYTYITLAERNGVAKSFYDLANKSEVPSEFYQKVPPAMRPVTATDAEMAKFLKDNGIDGMPEEALTTFRAIRQPLGKDEMGFFDKGKWTVLKVDPEVAEAFNATDRQTMGMLTKLLSYPAKALRLGSTLTPDFMARNMIRDQITAFSFSENGFMPFVDTFRGAASLLKKDADFQNWMKSGGANAAMLSLDRRYLQTELFKLIGENPEADFIKKAWNIATKPVEWLRISSELIENATRLGEFKRAVGDNASKDALLSSGLDSREVTLDFARVGDQARAMNMITAFFNAQVQGIDRAARAIKDNPMGTMARIGVSITLPSVLLWMANHDDPRYKELPGWQRDLFWIVMTKDHIYRIPKPFELGIIFGSGVERLLDAIVGDTDAKDIKEFLATTGGGLVPNLIPSAISPVLEQLTNHSFFNGHSLIPSNLEKMLPEYQYTEYNSELTKAIGHIVGTVPGVKNTSMASPMVIDNYLRAWTGGLGNYALQVADAGLRKTGVLPDPVKPESTLADIPVIKAFVVRYPSASAESIQRFREDFGDREKAYNTMVQLAKQGDFDASQRVMQMNPQAMVRMTQLNSALSQQSQLIRLIYKNPDIAPDQKRQLIDSTYYNMIEMTKMGNQMLKQVDQALKH
ncbi:hypothetical protein UFOVP7_42 [uncultured Caudovirales phage]|uniref:Large polyvalent protein associated domain-containing protein n=1 Tax=uncultured Caudovirales phage TaxID=2100421 RepID=A0A6J5KHW5_9CAUD|nr:hypothetical protein UFOVP7_42 [uncultured Caudovirales phage]